MDEVRKLIENLKIQCNKEEHLMMKEEDNNEAAREELERTADNVG